MDKLTQDDMRIIDIYQSIIQCFYTAAYAPRNIARLSSSASTSDTRYQREIDSTYGRGTLSRSTERRGYETMYNVDVFSIDLCNDHIKPFMGFFIAVCATKYNIDYNHLISYIHNELNNTLVLDMATFKDLFSSIATSELLSDVPTIELPRVEELSSTESDSTSSTTTNSNSTTSNSNQNTNTNCSSLCFKTVITSLLLMVTLTALSLYTPESNVHILVPT
jgi:hypothetical protein